jgi:hypothetical protein
MKRPGMRNCSDRSEYHVHCNRRARSDRSGREAAFFDVLPGGQSDWGEALEAIVLKARVEHGFARFQGPDTRP